MAPAVRLQPQPADRPRRRAPLRLRDGQLRRGERRHGSLRGPLHPADPQAALGHLGGLDELRRPGGGLQPARLHRRRLVRGHRPHLHAVAAGPALRGRRLCTALAVRERHQPRAGNLQRVRLLPAPGGCDRPARHQHVGDARLSRPAGQPGLRRGHGQRQRAGRAGPPGRGRRLRDPALGRQLVGLPGAAPEPGGASRTRAPPRAPRWPTKWLSPSAASTPSTTA